MRNMFLSIITSTLIFFAAPFDSSANTHSTLTSIGGGYGFLVREEGNQRQVMIVIDSRWPKDLQFVGGAQQMGELPHEAFKRNIAIKTGAIVDNSIYLGSWQRTNANPEGANDTCCFFAGFLSKNSPAPRAIAPFLKEVRWIPIEDVLNDEVTRSFFQPHLHFLRHFLNDLKTMPRQIIQPDFEHEDTPIVYNLS